MADDIVQTIKIEVEGADQAAGEIQKVGQATEDVQKTAASSAAGTQEFGKGLDQVSQKSGISSRELRSLSKIAKEFGADSVVVGLSLVRMAAVLGPIGAALFALGTAFAALKDQMKAANEAAKAVANTFATLAQKSAEMKLEDEAAFWAMTTAEMKKWNNEASRVADQYRNIAAGRQKAISADVSPEARQKGLIEQLRQAGVEIDDVNAGAEKLNENGNKALMVFAKLADKLSPIGKAELAKDMKSFGFTDEQIKSVEKGSAALKKAQEEAAKFDAGPAGQALKEFDAAVVRSQQTVGGWGQSLKIKFAEAVLGWKKIFSGGFGFFGDVLAKAGRLIVSGLGSIGSAIASAVSGWVTTAVPNAWQWITTALSDAVAWVGTKIEEGRAALAAWVATAPGAAWQWIVNTFNAAVEGLVAKATELKNSIVTFVTEAPGNAWQWIVDTFNSAVEWVVTKASELKNSIVTFVTEAPGNAWQWIVDTFNAAVASVIAKVGEASAAITSWVTTAVPGAFEWLKNTFFSIVDAILAKAKSSGLFGGGGAAAPAAAGGGQFAAGGLLGGRGTGTSDSNLAWVSRGEYIVPARVVQQPGVLAFLEALRRSGKLRGFARGGQVKGGPVENIAREVAETLNGLAEKINDEFSKIVESVRDKFIGILRSLDQSFQTLGEDIDGTFRQLVKSLWDLADKMKGGDAGLAGGGLLGGRGTGTSDSNLAWVSRGEHIMPARAVSQPGVLAFLEALRRSGGNLRDVLDGMGRFALGGMVRAPLAIPAFAGGGGMNTVTIQFPGLPEITGLRASSGVVDELRKAAAMAQVRSGGRKPSRYS